MNLTAKQDAFCLAYTSPGTDSALAAYRSAGYSGRMSDKTASEAASRLLKNSNVVARIAEIRSKASDEASMNLADHLADLKRLRDSAEDQGKFSAAVAAEIARGKASGLYIEKTEITGKDGGPLLIDESTRAARMSQLIALAQKRKQLKANEA